MSKSLLDGCFYLDSCIIISEILGQNEARMKKFRQDVQKHGIPCYVSSTVISECEYLINRTISFLEYVLKDVLVVYLEGINTTPRDLSVTQVSNEDLHIIKEAFMLVNQTTRRYDLVSDPFQAVEEWVVGKIDKELGKSKKILLGDFIVLLTANILEEITKLESDFEAIVELEARYVTRSEQTPYRPITDLLIEKGIHTADAVHISVVESHQRANKEKAIFLTFDYKTILLKWTRIQHSDRRLEKIFCCDPIYGLSHLR